MKELIDKFAVVAEIKRLLAFYSKEIENFSPIDLLNEMLEKLKKKGLLE